MKLKFLNNKYFVTIALVIIAAIVIYYFTQKDKLGTQKTNFVNVMNAGYNPLAMVDETFCNSDAIINFPNPNVYISCVNAIGVCEQEKFLLEWKNHIDFPSTYEIGISGCDVEGINYNY